LSAEISNKRKLTKPVALPEITSRYGVSDKAGSHLSIAAEIWQRK
jgi:hypothetical protein